MNNIANTNIILVLYGSPPGQARANSELYADGLEAGMVRPEFLYQTRDGKEIYFVDSRTCARVVNRASKAITTIIGNLQCYLFHQGFHSLIGFGRF